MHAREDNCPPLSLTYGLQVCKIASAMDPARSLAGQSASIMLATKTFALLLLLASTEAQKDIDDDMVIVPDRLDAANRFRFRDNDEEPPQMKIRQDREDLATTTEDPANTSEDPETSSGDPLTNAQVS